MKQIGLQNTHGLRDPNEREIDEAQSAKDAEIDAESDTPETDAIMHQFGEHEIGWEEMHKRVGNPPTQTEPMKTLESYRKNGHEFTLYARTGNLAIFHGKRIGGNSDTWEVIHIQSHNGREIAGKFFEPAEYPPSNEQWGRFGWTSNSAETARGRFESELALILQPKPAKP